MRNIGGMSWEEKVATIKMLIENINAKFDAYKELVSNAGHKIGFKNGYHFIDDNQWNDTQVFVSNMAYIILRENLSL